MRAHNIIFGELKGVSERVVHVSLGGKVHDSIYFFLFQYVGNLFIIMAIGTVNSMLI